MSEATAELFVSDCGKNVYPYGSKLHYFLGVYVEERQSDGSMFLKISCDVKNA